MIEPEISDPFTGEPTDYGEWWWVPVAGIAILLVSYYVPQLWPLLMGLLVVGFAVRGIISLVDDGWSNGVLILFIVAVIGAVLAYVLYSRRETIEEALSDTDTKTIIVWGTLGVIIGIGFAAFADIYINGYTFFVAFIGEFIPAAGPNILFAILLTPLLYGAWKQAELQSGR